MLVIVVVIKVKKNNNNIGIIHSSTRNDYNKNMIRSNNTCNSDSSIGSTRNRSNSNRSNSNSSSSSITGVLVVLPICSSERDATPAFF